MCQSVEYTIRVAGTDHAEAGRAAESLRHALQEADPSIAAKRVRTDADSMDFGTALQVVLAAPAIAALAKGVADWLARTHSSKLTVIGQNGTTIVENITARDAADLAEKLQAGHGGA